MKIVAIDHIQLAMPPGNEAEARRFYGDILGLTEVPKPEALRSSGGCWFEGQGVYIHIGVQDDFTPATKAHPGILVEDLAVAQRILEAGGVTVTPDDRIPKVRRFHAFDPFGNRLEFIQNGDGLSQQYQSGLEVDIPGYRVLRLNHLVLDYNGTMAHDGVLIEGVAARLSELSNNLRIHILTADTFGSVQAAVADIQCQLSILPQINQDMGKLRYIEGLNVESVVCIGNGRNDRLMLESAALGIVVIQREGAAKETLLAADIVAPDILAALDLLLNPLRLQATLRS